MTSISCQILGIGSGQGESVTRSRNDPSQRAMIAAKMATLKQGRPENAPNGVIKKDEAMQLLGIGKGSLDRAKYVLEHGSKALIELAELAITYDQFIALCDDRPKLKDLLVKYRPKGKRGPKPKDSFVDNVNEIEQRKTGNSRLYIEERLQRDHPKIWKDAAGK